MDATSLLRRTLRWAWTREEAHTRSTKATLRYTATLYMVALALIIATGVVLSQLGYSTLSFSLLLFGIWFTTFMGIVNVGWEWMQYRQEAKEVEPPTEPAGPQRELAPDLRLDPEIRTGFIATVAGLLSLMVSYRFALFIIENT